VPAPTRTADRIAVLVDLAALERIDLRAGNVHRGGRTWSALRHDAGGAPEAPHVTTAHRAHLDRVALPTIGRLARDGALSLCTYAEFEPPGDRAVWAGTWRELLGDIPVTDVAAGLSRLELGDDVFRDGARAGALSRLCARLKTSDPPPSDATADCGAGRAVAALERFRRLAARVQGDHLADLFHLWSGELAGCRYYLTTDDALAEFLQSRVAPGLDVPLRCEPIRAHELLRRLGVQERDARFMDANVVPIRSSHTFAHDATVVPSNAGRIDGSD
jgi:hypothetical protein